MECTKGKNITNKAMQELWVKKTRFGANYSRFIKSTLYSPAEVYPIMDRERFMNLDPQPLLFTQAPKREEMQNLEMVPS